MKFKFNYLTNQLWKIDEDYSREVLTNFTSKQTCFALDNGWRESNYLSQIQTKEQTIQTQQARLNQLQQNEQTKQAQISRLSNQITQLQSEKRMN